MIPLKLISLLLFILIPFSCGRAPGEYAGLCTADCSSTLVATDDMEIVSLLGDDLELSCNNQNIGDEHLEIPFRFKVVRPYYDIDPDKDGEEPSISKVPAPLISFNYTLIDGTVNGQVNDYETRCTDSCGVGLLGVKPICGAKDNNVKVLIQSGPVTKILSVKVKGV